MQKLIKFLTIFLIMSNFLTAITVVNADELGVKQRGVSLVRNPTFKVIKKGLLRHGLVITVKGKQVNRGLPQELLSGLKIYYLSNASMVASPKK